MDKSIIFIFGIISVSSYYVVASNFNFESPIAKLMFLKLIKDTCYQNATDKEYEAFTNLTDSTMNCIKTTVTQNQVFKTPLDKLKNSIQECGEKLIERMEDCLPEESKDWPQFNFDIAYSFLDFVYEYKKELTSTELTEFIETCVESFQQDAARAEVIQCFSGFDPNSLSIKTLCRNMITMEKCILTQINKRCPGNSTIEKVKAGFFEALRDPCVDYSVTVDPTDDFYKTLSPQSSSN